MMIIRLIIIITTAINNYEEKWKELVPKVFIMANKYEGIHNGK